MADIQVILPTEKVSLIKFYKDWAKTVIFLLLANFWGFSVKCEYPLGIFANFLDYPEQATQ